MKSAAKKKKHFNFLIEFVICFNYNSNHR